MGVFNYDNPFMAIMIRIANLMLLSLYWLLCCLPIITIIPACAALYHSTVNVVQGNGVGVTKAFFRVFIRECKCGIALSFLCFGCCCALAYGWFLSGQLWGSDLLGLIFMALGMLLAVILIPSMLYIPPVLSRFELNAIGVLQLSLYFSSQHFFRNLYMLALLGLMVFLVDFYPVLLLILPGMYMDLTCARMDRILTSYIKQAGLEDDLSQDTAAAEVMQPEMSCIALDQYLTGTDNEVT